METDGDSQDVDSHAPVTMNGDIISEDAYGTTDFTLSTEHDVFKGLHRRTHRSQVDVLDSVTIEDHLYSV
jgi:hypothetical protein